MGSKLDWRKFCKDSVDQLVPYLPPSKYEGLVRVFPPSEFIEIGEKHWANAVVAQLIGRTPNFSALQKILNLLWGNGGAVDLRPAGTNLFLVNFSSSEDRDRVIEGGPWHFQNLPMFVRKWEPEMETLEFTMDSLPVWVQLSNIPLELFHQKGIGCIASAIGKQWIPKKKEIVNNKVSSVLNCEEKDIDKIKIGEAYTSKVDPDLIDSIRCDSDKTVAANVSNGKMLGKACSVHRYALLQSPIDSKSKGQPGLQNNEAGKGGVSSVAALMAGIKAQVAEEIQARQESQAKVSTEDNKKNMAIAITEEEDDVSEDSFDEFDGLVQKTKKGLPAIGMLRTPRLAAAGAAEAVKAVKARNKKCRRQAKKASASKK
ncbi:hypothetical protein PTKIN_Ptkin02bG0118400 [Pterospermum kingtungense]